jgi:perosamine synthetase
LYKENLKNSNILFHAEHKDVHHSYWMCSILIDKIEDRDLLRNHLSENGIETRPLFYPVHTMPMYASKHEKHKIAENLGWRGMNLPSYPGLTKSNIGEIASSILNFV